MKPVIHDARCFVAGSAKTVCGIYVKPGNVSAYPREITCRRCRRKLNQQGDRK